MTLYDIKPGFQSLLHPMVKRVAAMGISANQVTLAAAAGSIAVGILLFIFSQQHAVFLILPVWMFIRMALNAVDGMLAREFKQKTHLGAYLNELCDVVSDAALIIPFALIDPFSAWTVVLVIFLAMLSEFAGVIGPAIGASRRYDGPSGKSDRALIFGALGLWLGIGGVMPQWLFWLMPVLALLLSITIFNRIKQALAEVK